MSDLLLFATKKMACILWGFVYFFFCFVFFFSMTDNAYSHNPLNPYTTSPWTQQTPTHNTRFRPKILVHAVKSQERSNLQRILISASMRTVTIRRGEGKRDHSVSLVRDHSVTIARHACLYISKVISLIAKSFIR